uniref:NADH dehydrogenase subunit 3 n=1 Tax=Saldoida armata TaxID=2715442 RepID=UPI002E77EEB7|nr:NADH dehydrogenase subunit 3 [Saldoida armata]WQB61743.1 NADH dehydrogenase subunit 3 [Saldoida armata]
MMKIMYSMIMLITMSMMIMIMCSMISSKSKMNQEKMSPFECGFDPKSSPRLPFSIQFFLIAVLFLIFDIEIVIILPMVITIKMNMTTAWMVTVTLFTLILVGGLMHEWKNGVLEWAD